MWEISNYNQIISFLLSICLGSVFCFFYDVVRALRKVCINSFFAVAVTDVLLWTFYAFITFIFLMATTNGEIRAYVLWGELIGFGLFRISISKLLFPFLSFIILKAYALKRKTTRILGVIYTKIEELCLKMLKYMCNLIKSIKKLLKNTFKLLYTNKNCANVENALYETKTKA